MLDSQVGTHVITPSFSLPPADFTRAFVLTPLSHADSIACNLVKAACRTDRATLCVKTAGDPNTLGVLTIDYSHESASHLIQTRV